MNVYFTFGDRSTCREAAKYDGKRRPKRVERSRSLSSFGSRGQSRLYRSVGSKKSITSKEAAYEQKPRVPRIERTECSSRLATAFRSIPLANGRKSCPTKPTSSVSASDCTRLPRQVFRGQVTQSPRSSPRSPPVKSIDQWLLGRVRT